MRLEALVSALARLVRENEGNITVVIDGPLGPSGPPTVDRECQRGAFQKRVSPASVTGGSRALVEATYQVTDALVGARSGSPFRFSAAREPNGPPLQIFETMPTIGLAVLLPMVGEGDLSGIAQKSDFYWVSGAGAQVAGILCCPLIADEVDHDALAGPEDPTWVAELSRVGRVL